ncbi:unnamed protein product [Protopolystoma xenopodis]|uniref:Uncharacterized protein n=1 Tax=Protopolystoma xenopodis TaxID=117903 RepID=A0A448WKP7_9PLAT|nr:unnamed protein product [Protopolystoma xenopodis]
MEKRCRHLSKGEAKSAFILDFEVPHVQHREGGIVRFRQMKRIDDDDLYDRSGTLRPSGESYSSGNVSSAGN